MINLQTSKTYVTKLINDSELDDGSRGERLLAILKELKDVPSPTKEDKLVEAILSDSSSRTPLTIN